MNPGCSILDIVNNGGRITLTADDTLDGNRRAVGAIIKQDHLPQIFMKEGTTLRQHGIASIRWIFKVTLQRKGNGIDLTIDRGEVVITAC